MTEPQIRPDATEELTAALRERILVMDGAMGTMIQRYGLSEEDYRGERFKDWAQDIRGNSDLLSLSSPDVIRAIHREYLEAGADLVETNTFSAQRISQADYGMEDLAYEMNYSSARLAREACDAMTEQTPDKPRWVIGALGPTNTTASISPDVNDPGKRNITYDSLVEAYLEQARGLFGVRLDELLEAGVAEARVVDVGRDRGGPVGRPQATRDEARPVGLRLGHLVGGLARQAGRLEVQLVGQVLHAVVGLGDPLRAEGVGGDDVGTGLEVLPVDRPDDLGLGQAEQVAVAAHLLVPVGEPVAAITRLVEPVTLDHRAHRAVDHQDALGEEGRERLGGVRWLLGAAVLGSGHRCTPVVVWGMHTA